MSSVVCSGCGERNSEFNLRCSACAAVLPQESDVTPLHGGLGAEPTDGGGGRPGSAAAAPPAWLAGGTPWRYEVGEKLGSGGMSLVYRAQDVRLRRAVALKILAPVYAQDERSRGRFEREARAASALDHPNIATVHEIGEHEGQLYIAMALYEGETLERCLARRGRLAEAEALPIVEQIAAGLGAAHAAGIVHRDLKPANVMLTAAGPVKLLDFGLAKRLDGPASVAPLTGDGQLLGTLAYMAPEQLRGRPVGPAADLYALGVLLFETVTGRRPFTGDLSSMVARRLSEPAPSPRELLPGLDVRWEAAILRCLEREPEARFASAAEVVATLRAPPGSVRVRRRAPRRPRRRSLAAAAGLLVLLAGGGLGLQAARGRWLAPAALPAPGAPDAAAVAVRRSVAVLGFRNLSEQGEAAWLSTALTEMLRTELAAGETLRLVSGEDVARVKLELGLGEVESVPAEMRERLRQNLAADLLVLGSYLALGQDSLGGLRLDLRLQDARSGKLLSTVGTTGTAAQLFVLVAQAGAQMRKALGLAELEAAEAETVLSALPRNLEAARAYAEGLARLRRFDAQGARELLERAITADPDFAVAHQGLALAWATLGHDAQARAAAQRAFELSAGLSREARLLAEGFYRQMNREWSRALPIYRELFERSPDNLEYGLRLADLQFESGRTDEMLATAAALRRLPPPARDDPRVDLIEARAIELRLDYAATARIAEAAAAKARERGARLLLARARTVQGWALRNVARRDEALAAAHEARQIYEEAGDRANLFRATNIVASVLQDQGSIGEAIRWMERGVELCRQTGWTRGLAIALGNLGGALQGRGELGRAVPALREALEVWRELPEYKAGMVMGLTGLGDALRLHGELAAARTAYDESVQLGSGDAASRRWLAGTLLGLGELLLAHGELQAARSAHEQAEALWTEVHDSVGAGRARIARAAVELDAGRLDRAEALARAAAEQFRSDEAIHAESNYEPLARGVLALALLEQGRPAEARAELAPAAALLDRERDFETWGHATLAQARVEAASGAEAAARAALEALLAAAAEGGWAALELEARLALAELDLHGGGPGEAARGRLRALSEEARRRGFERLARKAAEPLR